MIQIARINNRRRGLAVAVALTAALSAASIAPALAQEQEPPTQREPAPPRPGDEEEAPGFVDPLPEGEEPVPGEEAEAEPDPDSDVRTSDTLDSLFDKLKRAGSDEEAKAINRAIQLRWLRSGSDTIDLLMRRALKAMESKDYALSLDLLDAVIDLRPGYAEGWNKRATVHYLMRDFGRSLGDIEQTLKLEPRHFGALSGLGSIFKQLGKDEDALRVFEKALQIYPRLDSVQDAYRDLLESTQGRDI